MEKHNLDISFDGIKEGDFFNRSDSRVSVLSGTNNSGKSLLLKSLFEQFYETSYYCGTNRYFDIDVLPIYNEKNNYLGNAWKSVRDQITDERNNRDPLSMPFQNAYVRLSDEELERVNIFCSDCLGEEVKIDYVVPGNSRSDSFISIGGTPLAKSSSGSRMLINLVSILFNKTWKVVLIDEPELGLTPTIQNAIQNLLFKQIDELLPHLQHVYIATHSHIFLNKECVKDNFLVQRQNKTINVKRLSTYREFRDLQFTQLGNSLNNLQLPSGFVIVEGITDFKYLDRLIQLKLPDNKINFMNANNEGQIKNKVHDLMDIIGNLDSSPYCDRVLVVLDETVTPTLISKLKSMGLPSNCIHQWEGNGIEFYYPVEILRTIFGDSNMTATYLKLND